MEPIVTEATYAVPRAAVWDAITRQDQMSQWYFDAIPTFEAQSGFETRFNVHNAGRDYLHVWTVTEVVPQERLVYGWRYEGLQGDSTAVWELTDAAGGTHLKMTHSVVEPFPDDDPSFERESGVAGWNYFICDSLKKFLEGE